MGTVRHRIRWLSDDLKTYCRDPAPANRSAPHQRFERIFQRRTEFLGLMKTCGKLGITLWSYLGNRFGVENAEPVPDLASVVRARCAA
jgi:hypothetical protein